MAASPTEESSSAKVQKQQNRRLASGSSIPQTRSSTKKHQASMLTIPSSKMNDSFSRRRSTQVIQDALDIASDSVDRKLNRNTSNDRAFFGEKAFPLPKTSDADRTKAVSGKPTKSQAPNFFENTDVFETPALMVPEAPPSKPSTPGRSPRENRQRKKDKLVSSTRNTSDRGRHRSHSRGRRAASKRNLSVTEHSSGTVANHDHSSQGIPKTRALSLSRSHHRGRRSSSQTATSSGAARPTRTRSKSRDRSTSQNGPLRRMPKVPATNKQPRAGSDTLPPRSPKQEDARAARRTKSAALVDGMLQNERVIDSCNQGSVPPPPPVDPLEANSPSESRSALARRRASRASPGGVGSPSPTSSRKTPTSASNDVAPTIPVRSPDHRKSKSSRKSATRRRCMSKRHLLAEQKLSEHTDTTTSCTSLETASSMYDEDEEGFPFGIGLPLPATHLNRQNSSSGGGGSRTSDRQNSARSLSSSKHVSSALMISTGTGEVKTARPGLSRASLRQSNGRQADARIDGLLQKLRDPSCRNLMSGSEPGPTDDDSPVNVTALRRPGMMGRFSKNLMRLDE